MKRIVKALTLNAIYKKIFKLDSNLFDLRMFDFSMAVEEEIIEQVKPYLHHQFGCKFEPMESPCTCGLDRFVECK